MNLSNRDDVEPALLAKVDPYGRVWYTSDVVFFTTCWHGCR